ncbi:MAG: LytTR family DNA-binding domain-containing protein [Bacteroidia bacterium]
MINVLIIEDEEPAAKRLQEMLATIDNQVNVLNVIVSIKSAVKWFAEHEMPDLIFMDINLADGNSFEIFKSVEIKTPIIFITAYDQYALDAFKVNSVDYLLKPIKKNQLAAAIEKYKQHHLKQSPAANYSKLLELLNPGHKTYQQRIIIRYGENIKAVPVDHVAYFYTEEKYNFLTTLDKISYPIDMNLDEVESIINPKTFFRINRQFIININAIEKMTAYSKSRVKLALNPPSPIETIVSTERSPNFKFWLTGNN